MCGPLGGGDDSAKRAAEQAAQRERERKARIAQGTQSISDAFAGFNDDYFSGISTAYSDYAAPQLEEDFAEAKKQLNFALARKGLSASTAGADQQRKLNEQYNRFLTDVENSAFNYSRQAELDIENSRSDLLSQLTATEDPAAASEAALRRAELFSAPPSFDPLGKFVFEIARGLEGVSAAEGYQGLSNSPLFKRGGGGSSTIVN